MKKIFAFSLIVVLIVIFGACSDDSSPTSPYSAPTFNPFALWDTASGTLGSVVYCLAAKDTFVFAGTGNVGIYRSTNNGNSWTQINSGLTNMNVNVLLVKDSNIYAGTNGGVFRSINNGSTWASSNSGITNGNIYSFIRKDTAIFAGTASGVFRSYNSGQSWESAGLSGHEVNALTIRGSKLFAGTSSNGVFRSTNNGTDWTAINTGLGSLGIYSLAAKDTMLFSTSSMGVYRSSNDSSWTAVNEGLYAPFLVGLASPIFIVHSNILIGFSDYQGVYLSLNNGAGWISCNTGFTPPFSAYAFTYNGTYIFAGGQLQGGGGSVWRHGL